MSYERITDNVKLDKYCDNTDCSAVEYCKDCYFSNVYNRLSDLEDKIENGTLIELGYHIRKSYRNHDDQRYKIILIDEVEIDNIGYDGLTKAEAEKKLEELSKKP